MEEDKISVDLDIFSTFHDFPPHPPPHRPPQAEASTNPPTKFTPQPKIIRPRSAQTPSVSSTNAIKGSSANTFTSSPPLAPSSCSKSKPTFALSTLKNKTKSTNSNKQTSEVNNLRPAKKQSEPNKTTTNDSIKNTNNTNTTINTSIVGSTDNTSNVNTTADTNNIISTDNIDFTQSTIHNTTSGAPAVDQFKIDHDVVEQYLISDDDSLSKYFLPVEEKSNNKSSQQEISDIVDDQVTKVIAEESILTQVPTQSTLHSPPLSSSPITSPFQEPPLSKAHSPSPPSSSSGSHSQNQSHGIASEADLRELERRMRELDEQFHRVLLSSSLYPSSATSQISLQPSNSKSSSQLDPSYTPSHLSQPSSQQQSPFPLSPHVPIQPSPRTFSPRSTRTAPFQPLQRPLQSSQASANTNSPTYLIEKSSSFPIFHKPVPMFPKPAPALPILAPQLSKDEFPVFTFFLDSPSAYQHNKNKSNYKQPFVATTPPRHPVNYNNEEDIFAVSPLSNASPCPQTPPRSPFLSSSPLSNHSLSYSTDSLFMST